MQENEIVLTEYSFVGLSSAIYYPTLRDGKWYLVGGLARSFSQIVALCDIPEDEAVMLRLKYGG
jgi:hypothetical protein